MADDDEIMKTEKIQKQMKKMHNTIAQLKDKFAEQLKVNVIHSNFIYSGNFYIPFHGHDFSLFYQFDSFEVEVYKIKKYMIHVSTNPADFDRPNRNSSSTIFLKMEIEYKTRETFIDELFNKMFDMTKKRIGSTLRCERRKIFDEVLFRKMDDALINGEETPSIQEIFHEYKEKTSELIMKP